MLGCRCLRLAVLAESLSHTLLGALLCKALMHDVVQWRGALTFLFQLWVTSKPPQVLHQSMVPPVTWLSGLAVQLRTGHRQLHCSCWAISTLQLPSAGAASLVQGMLLLTSDTTSALGPVVGADMTDCAASRDPDCGPGELRLQLYPPLGLAPSSGCCRYFPADWTSPICDLQTGL